MRNPAIIRMLHEPAVGICEICGRQFKPGNTVAKYCSAHSIGTERAKFLRHAWAKLRALHPEIAVEIVEQIRKEKLPNIPPPR